MPDLRFIVSVHVDDFISFEDKSRLSDRLTDACAEVFPESTATVCSSAE